MKTKHPMKSRNNCYASFTSPHITIGPILVSHVFVITCTLGWDDGSSPTPKVESMACDYYTKCGEMPPCFGAPHITTFLFHTSKYPFASLIPQVPRMHNMSYCNITSPPSPFPFTNIINPIRGATCEKMNGVGGCDWSKCHCFVKAKLKIYVKDKFITCPKIHLRVPLEITCKALVITRKCGLLKCPTYLKYPH
jgi:hypothetical protein